jgi:hypothetical protein
MSPANYPVSPCCPLYVRLIHFLHLCTGRRPTCTFARCVSARASRLSLALSPCHHAHVPPRDLRSRPCQPVNLPTCQLVVRSDPPSLWASGPLTCIAVSLVNVSTCQHAPSWRFAPSCPLAATPRSPLHLCTGAPLRFAPLHGLSLVHRASEPPAPDLHPLSTCHRAHVSPRRRFAPALTPLSRSSTDTALCSDLRRSGHNPCGLG